MDFRRCLLLVFAVAGVTLVQQAQGASLREERQRTLSEKREIVDQKHVELDSNQTENEDRFLTSQLYSDDVRLGRFLRSMLKPKKRTVPDLKRKPCSSQENCDEGLMNVWLRLMDNSDY